MCLIKTFNDFFWKPLILNSLTLVVKFFSSFEACSVSTFFVLFDYKYWINPLRNYWIHYPILMFFFMYLYSLSSAIRFQ